MCPSAVRIRSTSPPSSTRAVSPKRVRGGSHGVSLTVLTPTRGERIHHRRTTHGPPSRWWKSTRPPAPSVSTFHGSAGIAELEASRPERPPVDPERPFHVHPPAEAGPEGEAHPIGLGALRGISEAVAAREGRGDERTRVRREELPALLVAPLDEPELGELLGRGTPERAARDERGRRSDPLVERVEILRVQGARPGASLLAVHPAIFGQHHGLQRLSDLDPQRGHALGAVPRQPATPVRGHRPGGRSRESVLATRSTRTGRASTLAVPSASPYPGASPRTA